MVTKTTQSFEDGNRYYNFDVSLKVSERAITNALVIQLFAQWLMLMINMFV